MDSLGKARPPSPPPHRSGPTLQRKFSSLLNQYHCSPKHGNTFAAATRTQFAINTANTPGAHSHVVDLPSAGPSAARQAPSSRRRGRRVPHAIVVDTERHQQNVKIVLREQPCRATAIDAEDA